MIKIYKMTLVVPYKQKKDKQFPRKLDSLWQKFWDDVSDLKNCVCNKTHSIEGSDNFHQESGAKLPDYMKD